MSQAIITPDHLDIEPVEPVLSDAAIEALAKLLVDAAESMEGQQ